MYQIANKCAQLIEAGNAIVLDTETTGFNGVAIQIALIDLKTKQTLLSTYIKNSEPIDFRATQVHGITEKMLINAPSQKEIANTLKPLVKNKVLVAFNVSFDKRVCERTFGDWIGNNQWQCAMKLAANALGARSKISLDEACKLTGVKLNNAHDAEIDTRATVELLHSIAQTGT